MFAAVFFRCGAFCVAGDFSGGGGLGRRRREKKKKLFSQQAIFLKVIFVLGAAGDIFYKGRNSQLTCLEQFYKKRLSSLFCTVLRFLAAEVWLIVTRTACETRFGSLKRSKRSGIWRLFPGVF